MFVSHVRYVTGTEQTKEKATAFTHEITVKLNASSTEFYLVKMIIITRKNSFLGTWYYCAACLPFLPAFMFFCSL